MEMYERARLPDHWRDIEAGHVDLDLAEYSDFHDVDERQGDDEAGLYADSGPGLDPLREQEAVWQSWERRNPGVAHPDRARAQRASGRRLRDADWTQGTMRFRRDPRSLGERARESRERGAPSPGEDMRPW